MSGSGDRTEILRGDSKKEEELFTFSFFIAMRVLSIFSGISI